MRTFSHVLLLKARSLTIFGNSSSWKSKMLFVTTELKFQLKILCEISIISPTSSKNYSWIWTYWCSNLLHGFSFSQCCTVRFLQGIKINGNTKWNSDLIGPGVSTTYGATSRINFVRDVMFSQWLCWKCISIFIVPTERKR